MFNYLANQFPPANRADVLLIHPAQLSRWLDEVWAAGPPNLGAFPAAGPFLGAINPVNDLRFPLPGGVVGGAPAGPSGIQPPGVDNSGIAFGFNAANRPIWDHLIYGYLLENTGLFEIFSEVVRLAVTTEQLSAQFTNDAVAWLRSTEELFFRDQPAFAIGSVLSALRPESRVTRRNAYWRMFGWDLAHPVPPRWMGGDGSQPWKRDVGAAANTQFRDKWVELLRQIWLARENSQNTAGPNPTDDGYLLLLCDSLRDMMQMRRRGGMLAREEFAAVSTMSWFDLTLSDNTSIVSALGAQAASPADRLALMAQRVGMTIAPRSRELFQLAPLVSWLLRIIEAGVLTNAGQMQVFYLPGGVLAPALNQIIDLWQSATGESLKGRSVIARQDTLARPDQPQQPLRAPGSQPLFATPPVPALNGARS